MKKFDWQATESAPDHYPMKILSGSLVYHDGSGSLYVPDGVLLNNGWGKGRSSHVVGPDMKPLPDRLKVRFFSYTENQFYDGDFRLPYDVIFGLFKDGFYSPNQEGDITYDNIVVGVAPGGAVAVWLWGYEKITEVFFGKADKVDIEWNRFTNATHMPREEYVRLGIEESITPEALARLRDDGVPIGLWSKYRVRYDWKPVFINMPLRDDRIRIINYFNGEQDYINYPLDEGAAASTRAIPRFLTFIWEYAPGKGRLFEMTFNEEEIFQAFKDLGGNNEPLFLEMRMEKNDGKNIFSAALRNNKESIKLKRTNLETYSVSDRSPETEQ